MNTIVLLLFVAIVTGAICLIDFVWLRRSRIERRIEKTPAFLYVAQVAFPLSVLFILLLTVNFELLLTSAVLLSGVIWLIDLIWLRRRRRAKGIMMPSVWVDYGRSFFPVLLLVLVVRSFLIQPFRVPTGSLEPTVMPGDLIAVNQYTYGLRLPVVHTKILKVSEPKIGDIAVFRWPVNPKVDFVKRVIGTPGDVVEYKDKVLYVNGKEATQDIIGPAFDVEPQGNIPAQKRSEDLQGVKHDILVRPNGGDSTNFKLTVPQGMYFMMGDNRDDSDDSRSWGFVPEANLVGKAFIVWLSWDNKHHNVRWRRIGNKL